LAGEPEVLIADEPTSNLDPQTAEVVATLLRERHSRGTTILVASHDPRLIASAEVVYEMRSGHLAR